ncbi:PREDICTED: ankyrin repeat and SOCS box protein 16 [Nanorana parkeri]|uniref:ankyrin repeat and SOCS box protein 16 n=1 Tax=Nanorana parkeri TaxID=125878 RepID=UPI00085473CC|nr:PREDICTED: ankyrin repeat and SOCS box protein 16 [Nanorana parkeri]
MSRETFPFTAATLRSLQWQREQLEYEDRRRAVNRQCLTRRLQTGRSAFQPPASQRRHYCRDTAIHNALYTGDMERIKVIFKEQDSAEVVVETVSEELQWSPDIGLFSLIPKKSHTTPLRITAARGYSECVRHLICHGANPNSTVGGRGALHDACEGAHTECTQLLLSRGADPNLQSEDGQLPLHFCTIKDTLECAKQLLEYGGIVNLPCHNTRAMPLHVAATRGLEAHAALYLSLGADPRALNREGETPVNAACAAGESPQHFGRYLRVVEMLLKAGGNAGTPGKKGHGPLHNASSNCHLKLVQMLLDHGASVNVINSAGYTPLDCALQVCTDYPECQPHQLVQTLLNHGSVPPSVKMWRYCAASPLTFEILLNAYDRIPPGDIWIAAVPSSVWEEHQTLYESISEVSNQPRRLQHLARCAVRSRYGSLCYKAILDLQLPPALTAYLLLQPEGSIH